MRLFHIVFLLLHTIVPESLLNQYEKENALVQKTGIFPKHIIELLRYQQFSTPKETTDRTLALKNRFKNDEQFDSSSISENDGSAYRQSKRRSKMYNRRRFSGQSDRSSSLDEEMVLWKKDFDQDWLRLKQQAIAERELYPMIGDVVNMAQARPFGTPCGDHNEHDWPWGTCMLPEQCEGEYRIYKGDLYCGRTALVCCAVQLTQHDMYQGLDISFIRTSSSSSLEKLKHQYDSSELRRMRRRRTKVRRYRQRRASKKLLHRKIRQLLRHLRKSLYRAYRNTTIDRTLKMRELMKQVQHLKKKYLANRQASKIKFDNAIKLINNNLFRRLVFLNSLHQHFLVNQTFRQFLKDQNFSSSSLRTLQLTTPNLTQYISKDGNISEGLQEILRLAMTYRSSEETNSTVALIDPINEIKAENLAVDSLKRRSRIRETDFSTINTTTVNINIDKPLYDNMQEIPPIDSLNKTDSDLVQQAQSETNANAESDTGQKAKLSNENYQLMETNSSTEVKTISEKTRRSGTVVKSNKKAIDNKDYSEYDVEYGILAYI